MGLYTRITRDWLEHRFRQHSTAGVFQAHMPIYGVGAGDCEGNHAGRLARILRILRRLDELEYATLLDVGGAEGYLPHLAATIHGADGTSVDLSHEACRRANELFGLPSAAVDSHLLPFDDGAFDVVVCSEVIEHLEHPIETIRELRRVARVAVILTTEEVHFNRAHIDGYLFRRPGWPHMDRNLFHPDDLALCFPGGVLEPQCDESPPTKTEDTTADPVAVRAWLESHTSEPELRPRHRGVVVTECFEPAAQRPRRHTDTELLDRLFATTVAKGPRQARPEALERLVSRLRDPVTKTPLRLVGDELVSTDGQSYPVQHGVPDLVRLQHPPPSRVELAEQLRREYADRADAILALRDRLFLPERWTNEFFDLRREEDRRGFWPNDHLRARPNPAPDAGFSWHAVGPDPWVVTPCLQRPIREIEIEMRVHAPDLDVLQGTGQVFWKGPGDATFVEANSVKFDVPNDGNVHTHRVSLAAHPDLPDEIQWLRLDLIDGQCEVDFLSLRLI